MKNVQIIDGAQNCTFSIFKATDEEFGWLFPAARQDIQFAEDIEIPAGRTLAGFWERPIRKQDVMGIHGTVFYDFQQKRHLFPATKREQDWMAIGDQCCPACYVCRRQNHRFIGR